MMKHLGKHFGVSFTLLSLMSLSHLKADEIEVFAAASLTNALTEIASTYEKATGDKIIFNFAASSTLDMQIKAGAPSEIFFSADEAKMDDLEKQGLVTKGTRRDLLSNSLVIVVPADSSASLASAAGLADPKFQKIALGQPQSVPAGIYAAQYLKKIGIWSQVEARVIPCESVRAALAAVETGNVDAGIVYKTDAMQSQKIKVAYEVPVAEGPTIRYPIAVVLGDRSSTATGRNRAAASKKFLDYLAEPASLKTFEKYGFITKT